MYKNSFKNFEKNYKLKNIDLILLEKKAKKAVFCDLRISLYYRFFFFF